MKMALQVVALVVSAIIVRRRTTNGCGRLISFRYVLSRWVSRGCWRA
ncbi:MAG: hypothetical protein ACJAW7_003436, partial [Candidatus Azotimanducaceae bacterium]